MPTQNPRAVTTRRMRRAVGATLAAGALLLAACGDDDETADDTTTTTTEVEETTTTTEVEETTTTTEAEETGEWIDFTDPATGISVRLPGQPQSFTDQIEAEPGNTVTLNAHIVDLGDIAATFGVYELQFPFFDLETSIEGSATEIGGTIDSTTPTEYEGFEALDGVISFNQPPIGDAVVLVRVVSLAEDRQQAVQISVIGAEAELDMLQEMFDEIVDSLTF
ncbi:MAG: hypothetical protein ACXIVQ_15860 [Acidimicrobiales bacterium]